MHRSLALKPCQCAAVPSLRILARVLLRHSFAASLCPCAVPSLRTLARAPFPRYVSPRFCFLLLSPYTSLAIPCCAAPAMCLLVHSLAISRRASFLSRCLVSARKIDICAMCNDLGFLFRLQESRPGLPHRLLAAAIERRQPGPTTR